MATSTESLPRAEPRQLIDSDVLYEVLDGRIVEKTPIGVFQTWIAKLLYDHLRRHMEEHKLGRVVPEALFDLAPLNRQRRPDVAFVSYERWSKDRKIPRTNAWAVIPDLAVEVVSPSNTMRNIAEKIQDLFQAGVRLVWVILEEQGQVYVYRSPTRIEVLTQDQGLTGDDVLPEFQLPLAELIEQGAETEDTPDQSADVSATDEERK